jgi:type I restriction enzyme, S subunit
MLDERKITKQFLAPYLRNTDVQWDGINVDDLPEMDFDEDEQQLYSLRPGDILMCEGGEIGRCAIWNSDRRCFYQKALHRLRPTTSKDDPRYFVLVMRAAVEAGLFTSQASAATIQHLPAEKLRIVRYPAPPINEQRDIVAYVSRHTGRIDALVAAKQRLLGLLAEKRTAIIATAVTRGLDPKVKLRDSGVPWLGEIPVHWETERAPWPSTLRADWPLVPLRYLVKFISGGTPDKGNSDFWTGGTIPWVSPKDMKVDRINDSEDHITEAALDGSATQLAPTGSVLVVVRGMILAHTLPVAVTTGPVTINQDIKALICGPRILPEFLHAVLAGQAEWLLSLADSSAHGTKKLETEILQRFEVPCPPLDEQHAVIEHIALETARLDAVRAATERTIALLKERRAALIAAAVTGQLDVGAAA